MENPGRTCTVCNYLGKFGVGASFVATDEFGFEWFECDGHPHNDLERDFVRVRQEPIDDWFRAIAEGG